MSLSIIKCPSCHAAFCGSTEEVCLTDMVSHWIDGCGSLKSGWDFIDRTHVAVCPCGDYFPIRGGLDTLIRTGIEQPIVRHLLAVLKTKTLDEHLASTLVGGGVR